MLGSDSTTATLTDTYSDNSTYFRIGGLSQLELDIAYTPLFDASTIYLKVETGPDYTDFYYLTTSDIVAGAVTINLREPETFLGTTAATEYKFSRSYPIANKWCRVSVKEDLGGEAKGGGGSTVTVYYVGSGE